MAITFREPALESWLKEEQEARGYCTLTKTLESIVNERRSEIVTGIFIPPVRKPEGQQLRRKKSA